MSLILDALRKSEAERQRGHAPSLHSPAGRNRTPRRVWPLAGTMAALALVGGTSWLMLRSDPTPSDQAADGADATDTGKVDAAVAANSPDAVVTAKMAPAADGSLSTAPVRERESAPMLATDVALGNAQSGVQGNSGNGGGEWPDPALNAPATGAQQPFMDQTVKLPATIQGPTAETVQALPPADVAAVPAPPVVAEVPQRVDGLSDPNAAPFVPSAEPLPPATDATTEPAVPALPTIYELDFAVRRELPKLNLSMHVYSKDPERRFALVNGKRYVPGGEAIDGKVLVVDVIPDGVVCEVNGQRFLLPRQ